MRVNFLNKVAARLDYIPCVLAALSYFCECKYEFVLVYSCGRKVSYLMIQQPYQPLLPRFRWT